MLRTGSMMAVAVWALAAAGGCALDEHGGEDAGDAEEVAVTEQAFSANWNYSWGDTKASAADIGTSVGRTCFLTGIGGHFRPIGAYLFSGGTYPAMAGVRKKANGNYEIYVQPSSGKHLIAYARCVNSAENRVEATWTSNQQASSGDKILGPAGGGRQCFLQDIKNYAVAMKDDTGAIYSYGWAWDDTSNNDEIRVYNDGSYWKLWVEPGAHTYPVNMHASAVCVDATTSYGSYTENAANNAVDALALTSAAGATCGLTGVRGHMDADYGDWNDAVYITQSGAQFTLNVENGKRGWAHCMK